MATIQYTKFNFNKPYPISEGDFDVLKEMLTKNRRFRLNPPSGFFEAFKIYFIFLGAGGIGIVILSLDFADWLNAVGGIIAFIGIGSILSFIPSFISYLEFLNDKSTYYSSLKRDIIRSKNYMEFLNLRNKNKK